MNECQSIIILMKSESYIIMNKLSNKEEVNMRTY